MKFVKIFGAFFVLLIAAIVVILLMVDVNQYKGVVQDQAKTATGRAVTVGDMSLSLSLNPAIVVKDVKVANAPGGSRPEMATIKKVEAHTQLIPLLFGNINITSLTVEDPDVLFETDANGKGNWEFGNTSSGGGSSSGSVPLTVNDISVTGLKFAYHDKKAGTTADVAAKSVDVDIDGPVMDLNVRAVDLKDVQVTFKDAKTSGGASLASLALTSKGKITDLGITNIKVADAKANYKGEGTPLDVVLDKLALDDKGALDVAGKFGGQDFKANGTLAPIAALASMNKAFPMKVDAEGMGLKASTDLMLDLSKKSPSAKGSITIPELDLSKIAPAQPAPGSKGRPATANDKVFPDTALPWASLEGADLDVKVSIPKVILPSGLVVTDLAAPVTATGGKITVKPLSLAVAGGTVTADITADAGAKSVALKGEAKGFTAERVAMEMKKGEFITQGPIDFNVNVRGAGNSVHGIMSTLDGTLVVGMGESRIRNDALNFIGADVIMQILNVLNPLGNKDPYTVAKCGVVNLQIANGVANTQNGIALVTDKMQVTSSGTINLGTERVDLVVKPKASSGIGVGLGQLVSAVNVSGPMLSPGIGIDKAGAAKTLGKLGAAFATGGLSVLAQGAKDRVDTASGDPCQAARTWTQKK